MKKKLEAELISIAHRILKLKKTDDFDKLHKEAAQLYEKLTVLKFAKDTFEEDMPTIGNDSSFFEMLNKAFNNSVSDTIEFENKTYVNLDEVEDNAIVEPVMEKIKDMVAFMPLETEGVDANTNSSISKSYNKLAIEGIPSELVNVPEFEPVKNQASQTINTPKSNINKSLNDKLKADGIQIGLNDKLAFIKHLFGGKSEDFHRVISQINTTSTLEEAQNFIHKLVKPDYNNWKGKEDYELRFLDIVEAKFD